jgi:hypothetical protein|tara:strand:- start:909 stop:1088 length:180 start_codon:yes stop_codon:yes gene_type:complete
MKVQTNLGFIYEVVDTIVINNYVYFVTVDDFGKFNRVAIEEVIRVDEAKKKVVKRKRKV